MLGYPGAGKTTCSKVIHELTGAVHLWADHVRHKRFQNPNYSQAENDQLYKQMNQEAYDLLSKGQSVIFDTNFNYYKDREHLRKLAMKAHANTVLLWVTVPKAVAYKRATTDAHKTTNGFAAIMSDQHFNRLSDKLEKPRSEETFIEIDGTKVSPEYISKELGVKL